MAYTCPSSKLGHAACMAAKGCEWFQPDTNEPAVCRSLPPLPQRCKLYGDEWYQEEQPGMECSRPRRYPDDAGYCCGVPDEDDALMATEPWRQECYNPPTDPVTGAPVPAGETVMIQYQNDDGSYPGRYHCYDRNYLRRLWQDRDAQAREWRWSTPCLPQYPVDASDEEVATRNQGYGMEVHPDSPHFFKDPLMGYLHERLAEDIQADPEDDDDERVAARQEPRRIRARRGTPRRRRLGNVQGSIGVSQTHGHGNREGTGGEAVFEPASVPEDMVQYAPGAPMQDINADVAMEPSRFERRVVACPYSAKVLQSVVQGEYRLHVHAGGDEPGQLLRDGAYVRLQDTEHVVGSWVYQVGGYAPGEALAGVGDEELTITPHFNAEPTNLNHMYYLLDADRAYLYLSPSRPALQRVQGLLAHSKAPIHALNRERIGAECGYHWSVSVNPATFFGAQLWQLAPNFGHDSTGVLKFAAYDATSIQTHIVPLLQQRILYTPTIWTWDVMLNGAFNGQPNVFYQPDDFVSRRLRDAGDDDIVNDESLLHLLDMRLAYARRLVPTPADATWHFAPLPTKLAYDYDDESWSSENAYASPYGERGVFVSGISTRIEHWPILYAKFTEAGDKVVVGLEPFGEDPESQHVIVGQPMELGNPTDGILYGEDLVMTFAGQIRTDLFQLMEGAGFTEDLSQVLTESGTLYWLECDGIVNLFVGTMDMAKEYFRDWIGAPGSATPMVSDGKGHWALEIDPDTFSPRTD